jgi:hypothetical protein
LTEKYNFFYNIPYPWISVGIREDGDIYSPVVGIGDGKYFEGLGRE